MSGFLSENTGCGGGGRRQIKYHVIRTSVSPNYAKVYQYVADKGKMQTEVRRVPAHTINGCRRNLRRSQAHFNCQVPPGILCEVLTAAWNGEQL